MKVLVIDDNPDIVELVSVCIGIRWPDADTTGEAHGLKGLELIQARNPDLVILDIGLPDIDGVEVLRRLRKVSDVPVVMLTGQDRDVDIAICLREGADDYVVKPFSQIEFIARLEAVMRRSAGLTHLAPDETPDETPARDAPRSSPPTMELYNGTVYLHVDDRGNRTLEVNLLQQLRYMSEVRVLRVNNNSDGGVDIRLLLRQATPLRYMLVNLEGVAEVAPVPPEDAANGDDEKHLTITLVAADRASSPAGNWSPCVFCKGLLPPGAKTCPHCNRNQK